jgi:hypothetical protein
MAQSLHPSAYPEADQEVSGETSIADVKAQRAAMRKKLIESGIKDAEQMHALYVKEGLIQ